VEETFVNKNPASTLKLGVARGVVLPLAVALSYPSRRHGTAMEPRQMIAKLSGIFDSAAADSAVIDAGGVGYLAFCSGRTLGRLPPLGAPARLLIETHVREDHIHLYGFIDAAERDWFRLLTTVQGVGARLALAILSAVAPEALTLAILAQDKAALARADGVGPKLAARIVNELRDKVGGLAIAAQAAPAASLPTEGGAAADAVSALVNLGYRSAEAFGAVATAARRLGEGATIDALIRAGLQELAQTANSGALR
jgi:holliday junction DNA helicase RuvA